MFEAKCCRTSSHSQEIVVTLPVSPMNGQIHSGQNYVRQENCCFLRKNKIHEHLWVKCWGEWWCGALLYWLGVEATGGWWWPQQQPTAGVTVPASGSMSFVFSFFFPINPMSFSEFLLSVEGYFVYPVKNLRGLFTLSLQGPSKATSQ